MKVEYDSNNSGGNWWLDDKDWENLEKAGWEVNWIKNQKNAFGNGERFIGALATSAVRHGLPLREAVKEWERVTGKTASSRGCSCCGNPHNFVEYNDDGKWVNSGPNFSTVCDWDNE